MADSLCDIKDERVGCDGPGQCRICIPSLMHRTESSFLLATNGSCLSMQIMGIFHEICLTAAAGVALWSAPGHHPEAE